MNRRQFNRLISSIPAIWYMVFLVVPMSFVCALAFFRRNHYGTIEWTPTLGNFLNSFDRLYFGILVDTILLALATTGICFALGVPCAWVISHAPVRARVWLTLAIAAPSLSNLLIRIYAIQTLVRPGTILEEVFNLSASSWPLVMWGMITTYLPFMVLPLTVALDRMDPNLVLASYDLGASTWKTLISVVLPNIRSAVVSGCTMVFIPVMGEYVIPDLLGGARTVLLGNLITEQFLKARNWPFGAALALFLLVILVIPNVLSRQRVQKAPHV